MEPQRRSPLELITAAVLVAVLAAIAWMSVVAYWPDAVRLASIDLEVTIVLVLLFAALLLVSAVALVHTRK